MWVYYKETKSKFKKYGMVIKILTEVFCSTVWKPEELRMQSSVGKRTLYIADGLVQELFITCKCFFKIWIFYEWLKLRC